jgi:Ca2+-binding EF-hand superfamily protein
MSNRQFWSFLDLEFIYNTNFAKLFYKAACEFNDDSKLDYLKFMDYQKFIQFVTLFTKHSKIDNTLNFKQMRMKLIFALFDPDNSGEVDRIEFRNVVTSFIEMILTCKFDSEGIQEKIRGLNAESSNPQMMEKVLDNYVEEVFNVYSYNGELMSYEEWQKWLFSITGIDRILDFSSTFKY